MIISWETRGISAIYSFLDEIAKRNQRNAVIIKINNSNCIVYKHSEKLDYDLEKIFSVNEDNISLKKIYVVDNNTGLKKFVISINALDQSISLMRNGAIKTGFVLFKFLDYKKSSWMCEIDDDKIIENQINNASSEELKMKEILMYLS